MRLSSVLGGAHSPTENVTRLPTPFVENIYKKDKLEKREISYDSHF
jgi:hypothetical protein